MNQILELAERQGYLTTADAHALGGHRMQLSRLVREGALIRTLRGVYVPAAPSHPHQSHVLATRAALAADPFAAASHHSALALHGIDLFAVRWSQVHVIDPRCSSVQHQSLHRHVLRPGDRVETIEGDRVINLPLALCQVAARFGMVAGLVAMDHALRLERCTRDDLVAVVGSGRLRRGLVAARQAVELADGRAESPGESRLRAIVAAGAFPYEVQANVGGPGAGYRVDLLIDGRVALEFDGEVKYGGREGVTALVAEKRREDWIRSRGYAFMRTVWSELNFPVAIRRALHRHVVQARAQRAG